jgi:hypothetical protein
MMVIVINRQKLWVVLAFFDQKEPSFWSIVLRAPEDEFLGNNPLQRIATPLSCIRESLEVAPSPITIAAFLTLGVIRFSRFMLSTL